MFRNGSSLPLSGAAWLAAHHAAKAPERVAFAERVAALRPRKVIDLGCGPGLWLDLLDKILPPGCEFVGVDSDHDSLDEARGRAATWRRRASFSPARLDDPHAILPAGDVTLLFNMCGYLDDPGALLARLADRDGPGTVVVRQYDGAALRFGPLPTHLRRVLDTSLEAALLPSAQFRHYDMDRVVDAIAGSSFADQQVSFELFQREAPFDSAFRPYLDGTLEWTRDNVSEEAAGVVDLWRDEVAERPGAYFLEVDLVAFLS